tara:strand:+ start:1050 stop:2063 length:1014 start_codon:yes stop_codon:yes gene_type:complete
MTTMPNDPAAGAIGTRKADGKQRVRKNISLLGHATIACCLLATLASFLPAKTARIGLNVTTDAVGFIPAHAVLLKLPSLNIVEVAYAGAVLIVGGDTQVPSGRSLAFTAPQGAPITLEGLSIPDDWEVSLRLDSEGWLVAEGVPGKDSRRAQMVLDIGRGTGIAIGEGSKQIIKAAGVMQVQFEMDRFSLRFNPRAESFMMIPLLRPRKLSFINREPFSDPDTGSEVRNALGGIRTGTLRIADHPGEETVPLGPVDRIGIDKIADGSATSVRFVDQALLVDFRGTAQKVENGLESDAENLKPSVLDILVANGLLKLCIAIFSFFAGLELRSWIKEHQ